MNVETLRAVVGEEAFSIVKDEDLFGHLLSIQDEQSQAEKEYQGSKDKAIKARKERRMRELQAKREEKNAEVANLRHQEQFESYAIWQKFLSEKLFMDGKIIQKIYDRSVNDEEEFSPEDCYCAAIQSWNNECEGDDTFVSVLGLSPTTRKWFYVNEVENDNGEVVDYSAEEETYSATIDDKEWLWLIVKYDADFSKMTVLDYDISPMDGHYKTSRAIRLTPAQQIHYPFICSKIYFGIEDFKGRNCIVDTNNFKVYDAGCITDIDDVSSYVVIGDEYTVFFNSFDENGGILDYSTGKITSINKQDSKYYYVSVNDTLTIRGDGGKSRLIAIKSDGSIEFDVTLDLRQILQTTDGGTGYNIKKDLVSIRTFGKSDLDDKIVKIQCVQPRSDTDNSCGTMIYNAVDLNNPNEAIFGKWSLRWVRDTSNTLQTFYQKRNGKGYILEYNPSKKAYFISTFNDSDNQEKCDRYGRTEKELAALKNFKDWRNRGGHSPEAQAQMDKMWADRQDSDDWGVGAMRDWDDDDLYLDYKYPDSFDYNKTANFNTALQKFDDDDRWRGRAAFKDPGGYSDEISRAVNDCGGDSGKIRDLVNGNIPDYVRRSPYYRIGKNGKPIDQPWYDEDEVPANLSDRVIREEKINEQYNNLQSLMRRMGLID